MESYEIDGLREWAPLTDLLEKIPARIQKSIFSQNLNITSVSAVPEFIALGTDAGIVFWYNRLSGEVQKLRNETSSAITCLRIVSSVEFMVAAGNASAQVTVFQIQKELPPDLNLVAPLTKVKPIERYTIRDLHKGPVTCCEWSKNGMKLFSGDKQGVVVLTEFDYQAHISKSIEILNEAYDIVQLSLSQQYLLVSTTYRSIVCFREKTGQWQVNQVGKKDRKFLSGFGGTFCDMTKKKPTVICSRPGLRFWIADINGSVQQTILFKDAITKVPAWDIPLLNPSKEEAKPLQNFGKVYMYSKNYVITHDMRRIFILNLEKLRVEGTTQPLRGIMDIAICGREIFILEGPRSLIRLSSAPEPPNKTTKIIFNPLLPPPVPCRPKPEAPFVFEVEEEAIINAEECFELPPIHHVEFNTIDEIKCDPTATTNSTLENEQNRRLEVFERIAEMDFEDSILYKSGVQKKHKKTTSSNVAHSSKKNPKGGIVEIGQAVSEKSESCDIENKSKKKDFQLEVTTKPLQMDASFCTDSCLLPDLRSPDTLQKVLKPKERALAESLSLQPVKLIELTEEDLKKSISMNENNHLPILQYPIKYPLTTGMDNAEVQTTPRKKMHFINDEIESPKAGKTFQIFKENDEKVLSENMNKLMIRSDCSGLSRDDLNDKNESKINGRMATSLHFVSTQRSDNDASYNEEQQLGSDFFPETIPEIQRVPDYMKIPTIWNVRIENVDETGEQSEGHVSGDWEIVDN